MDIQKVSSESQIILPKEFAGKLVSIERLADGVLQIKSGEFIPDSEKKFHTEKFDKKLKAFDKWMEHHVLQESDLEEMNPGNIP